MDIPLDNELNLHMVHHYHVLKLELNLRSIMVKGPEN
jgi:hypothetical protein